MNWDSLNLSQVTTTITKGTTPTTLGMNYSEEGIPFVRVTNFKKGILSLDDDILFVSEETHNSLSRSKIQSGDVLMAIAGTIGRSCIVPSNSPEANCNQAVCVIRADESQLDKRYLNLWLSSDKALDQLTKGKVSGVISNLSLTNVRGLKIPLPPLAEQKRIAAILDAADALRAKRQQALAHLDDLLQSTFLTLFGDPVTNPIGWETGIIADLLESANYGTSKKADSEKGQYPVLRMNNITYTGGWDFSSLKFMDLDEKELSKYTVKSGELLFNRTNSKELVGKTAVYRESVPMAFAGYLVRARPNEKGDAEYIGAFMNLPQTKQFLQNLCNNIVGMANINAKKFQGIPIPLPPLPLQQRFAAIVGKIEAQKARHRAHLAELDTLFASLQSRAFSGEL